MDEKRYSSVQWYYCCIDFRTLSKKYRYSCFCSCNISRKDIDILYFVRLSIVLKLLDRSFFRLILLVSPKGIHFFCRPRVSPRQVLTRSKEAHKGHRAEMRRWCDRFTKCFHQSSFARQTPTPQTPRFVFWFLTLRFWQLVRHVTRKEIGAWVTEQILCVATRCYRRYRYHRHGLYRFLGLPWSVSCSASCPCPTLEILCGRGFRKLPGKTFGPPPPAGFLIPMRRVGLRQ